jgi:mono/diheme cytochrome c family protein
VNFKNLPVKLAPFAIGLIIALFIYNIYSHGKIVHPGEALFKVQCAQCHGDNGEGTKKLVPPLNGADFAAKNIDSIPCWLKFGLNHPITVNDTVYDQAMYPSTIDEVQIANVINYMNSEFFKSDRLVNSSWVRNQWQKCR